MPASSSSRIQYIDRLRGLAVLAMFFVHPAVAWMIDSAKHGFYFEVMRTISGHVAPVFLFLAGFSVAIIADQDRKKGVSETSSKRKVATRGFQIWLLGYGFHIVSYILSGHYESWARMLKVDVLHCIGASLVILPWIAWPRRPFNLAALIYVIIVPFISAVLSRLPVETWLPIGISGYFKATAPLAQFAFFPYSTWIAFGLLIGPLWKAAIGKPESERRFFISLVALAVSMYAVGTAIQWSYYHFEVERLLFDGATPARGAPWGFWTKGSVVLCLLLLGRLTARWLDRSRPETLVLFGRASLFGYLAHLAIIYNVLGSTLRHRLSEAEHLAASCALSIAMYFLTLGWTRLRSLAKRWSSR